MKRVRYHASAEEDAVEAAAWYAAERPSLGFDFERELNRAVALLSQTPMPAVPYPGVAKKFGIRQLGFRRFPYSVVFIERDEHIIIIAVAHHARRPAYWKSRLHA